MEMLMIVYLNGSYLPHSEAKVSVDDRGFLFSDGVYEVAKIYEGRIFLFEPHLRRLRAGLTELRMSADAVDGIGSIAERLLDENNLRSGEATIYVQITRGAAPRAHAFPPSGTPQTVYVAVKPFKGHPASYFTDGVGAITVPDVRWSRCDIKSISLLPNVLANQQAKENGAFEALFIRDGYLIEGSHANLFGVLDGKLVTCPASGHILNGITRQLVLQRAPEAGIKVYEEPIPESRIGEVTEFFLTGTTTEIMPVTRLDGRPVGSGTPGPITKKLQQLFRTWVEEDLAANATAGHGAGV